MMADTDLLASLVAFTHLGVSVPPAYEEGNRRQEQKTLADEGESSEHGVAPETGVLVS